MLTLNNGAQAIAMSMSQLGYDYWTGVVLAKSHGDYVTWSVVSDENGNTECYAGRYHGADADSAREDFYRRSGSHVVKF